MHVTISSSKLTSIAGDCCPTATELWLGPVEVVSLAGDNSNGSDAEGLLSVDSCITGNSGSCEVVTTCVFASLWSLTEVVDTVDVQVLAIGLLLNPVRLVQAVLARGRNVSGVETVRFLVEDIILLSWPCLISVDIFSSISLLFSARIWKRCSKHCHRQYTRQRRGYGAWTRHT